MCKNEYDAHRHMKQHRVVMDYTTKPGYRLNQIRMYNKFKRLLPNMWAWKLAEYLCHA